MPFIPHTEAEQTAMLEVIGVPTIEALFDEIPPALRAGALTELPEGISEMALMQLMSKRARQDEVELCFLGAGAYEHHIPAAVWDLANRGEFLTAYTPYQPEISQGRLEALLNFQTMIIDLTGLEIANASLLDEATACAEAMTMAQRIAKSKKLSFFIDENCHPQNIEVMKTRAAPLKINLIIGNPDKMIAEDVFGAIFQYPGTYGQLKDFTSHINRLQNFGGMGIISADPMSLTLLKEPGAMGADIAVGSTQRFGVPEGFGGPHAAYIATKDTYKRSMPGRIVGVSIDSRGNKAYRLSLQTREQHIRREKATSNVCTAQALLAVMASFYGVFHGPDGLKAIAQRIHRKTVRLARGLEAEGFEIASNEFFDTIVVNVGKDQAKIINAAVQKGVNLRIIKDDKVGITVDERTRQETIKIVWEAFGILNKNVYIFGIAMNEDEINTLDMLYDLSLIHI